METQGFPVRQYNQPVKRYCQILDIVNDADKIAKYRECHSKAKCWPEIIKGIREVGILEMELYIHDNHVVMIVETPLDFSWDTAMAKLSTLPKQAEWEEYVALFQGCDSNLSSDQKWQMMERMFYMYD